MVWCDVQVGASGKPIALDKEGFPIVDDLDLAQEASTSHLDQLQVSIPFVDLTQLLTDMHAGSLSHLYLIAGFQSLPSKRNEETKT